MTKFLTIIAAVTVAAAASLITASGFAAGPHAHHAEAPAGTTANESSQAFEAVNSKMHKDMAIALTGDADTDFVRGMIPHHQGAIDMAEVLLKYGKDAEARKLAEEIIKAQQSEIAFMKDWLAKRGK